MGGFDNHLQLDNQSEKLRHAIKGLAFLIRKGFELNES